MMGMMTFCTRLTTTAPNAAPITTATAKSTTLPRRMNALNSLTHPFMIVPPSHGARAHARRGLGLSHSQPLNHAACSAVRLLPTIVLDDVALRKWGGASHKRFTLCDSRCEDTPTLPP